MQVEHVWPMIWWLRCAFVFEQAPQLMTPMLIALVESIHWVIRLIL